MKIKAVKIDSGWCAVADTGEILFEGYTFWTRRELYAALDSIYDNLFSSARKIHSGYRIDTSVLSIKDMDILYRSNKEEGIYDTMREELDRVTYETT